MKIDMRQTKRWMKWSAPLGLAIVLAACGGKNDDHAPAESASASASARASAGASPSASPSVSPSASAVASPSPSAGASASSGAGASAGEVKAGFERFTDKENGYSIQYPKDWTVQTKVQGVNAAFLSPSEGADDQFNENVTLVVQDLSGAQAGTMEQYANETQKALEKMITDFKLVSSEHSEDDKAFFLEYTGKQGQFDLHWQQAAMIKGDKAFIVTYTAEPDSVEKYQDTVGAMVDTLTYE